MPTSDPRVLISLRRAALGYAGARVLDGVDLVLRRGEFLAVVGDNGSGKSTLLRSLLGVLPVLAGEESRSPDLRLGYVPQQLALDPRFPVCAEEVVRMGLWRGRRALGRESAEDRRAVQRALERVGMQGHSGDGFGTLSGGQKQRVLLARALVSEANLLLLDEPTSGVDARAAASIHQLLDELHAEGVALVLVTHHPVHLQGRASRSCLVADGAVRFLDPAALLSAAGAAEFLG
ncbi:MAG: metal ABC transporter ATP-binding protein [Planctomycetes bacterium]|nr:metal ABC transporter ATP-binding protein [Planctomycetota bacterium]MBL7008202.1 metal ABC transporter ATP-binding protein [Planctomycetota bacterium]